MTDAEKIEYLTKQVEALRTEMSQMHGYIQKLEDKIKALEGRN